MQLLWAPDDAVFPIAYAERIRELIPHAEEPVLFPGAHHFLQDDVGPELLAPLIDFLGRSTGGAR